MTNKPGFAIGNGFLPKWSISVDLGASLAMLVMERRDERSNGRSEEWMNERMHEHDTTCKRHKRTIS